MRVRSGLGFRLLFPVGQESSSHNVTPSLQSKDSQKREDRIQIQVDVKMNTNQN